MAKKGIPIFGDEFRKIREQLFLTQRELAAKLEITVSGVQRIERAFIVNVLQSNFRKLAELAKATPEGLRDRLMPPDDVLEKWESDEKNRQVLEAEPPDAGTPSEPEPPSGIETGSLIRFVDIPTFDLSLSAGPWSDVMNAPDICSPDSIDQGLFRVRLSGDSMKPKYKSGQIIEFECLRIAVHPLVEGKDYYVQRDDGSATFKRLEKIEDDQLTFRALNRKKYPAPIVIGREFITRMALARGQFVPFEP